MFCAIAGKPSRAQHGLQQAGLYPAPRYPCHIRNPNIVLKRPQLFACLLGFLRRSVFFLTQTKVIDAAWPSSFTTWINDILAQACSHIR